MRKLVLAIFAIAALVIFFYAASWLRNQVSSGNNPTSTEELANLAIGKNVVVNGVSITLNDVVSDSRCPIDVQCIQAGWVTANVTLESGENKKTVDIASNAAPVAFGSYEISIEDIKPPHVSGTVLDKNSYLITFRVHAK